MHDSLTGTLKDVVSSMTSLIRSEINLAKTELKVGVKDAGKRAATLAICGALAVMGLSALLAFAVIGLGELLDGRYWLSALIVAVAFLAPAAILAIRAVKGFKEDVAFSATRDSFQRDKLVLNETVSRLKTDISAPAVTPARERTATIITPAFKTDRNDLNKRVS